MPDSVMGVVEDGTDQMIAEIRRDKYMLPDEKEWSDTLRRFAYGVFPGNEQHARDELFALLGEGIISPAGRTIASIGSDRNVTAVNCFVMNDIRDSMRNDGVGFGIMDSLARSAWTMQMGGGIGMCFSPLRPKGAEVKGIGADASGPLSFMDLWDSMCRTIMSAGYRRGAMMATLHCDHPDIEAFIDAKSDGKRFRMFNLSVLIYDRFMQAVKRDEEWMLGHVKPPRGRKVHTIDRDGSPWYVWKVVKARELWERILRQTYVHAEPGVIFIDRVNSLSNLAYCETVSASNPCFAAETLIVTDHGAIPIEELAGEGPVRIWDGISWRVVDNFRVTGRNQPMLRLTLQDGSRLRVTPAHTMILEDDRRIRAAELVVGDDLKLSDIVYDGDIEEPGAYLKGFLLGDGSLHNRQLQPMLYLYPPKYDCRERLIASAVEIASGQIRTNSIRELGFVEQRDGNAEVTRLVMTGLAQRGYALRDWCGAYKVGLPTYVHCWTRKAKAEFLAGLFDADGSTIDTKNGFGYQLSSISRLLLEDVQTILKSIGVQSKIALAKAGGLNTSLPGRLEGYMTQDCWRLSVAQYSSIVLSKVAKFVRLTSFVDRQVSYRVKPRMGKVVAIEQDAIDDVVYCCTVSDTHSVSIAIGITTGQCGEQMLPPNGDCMLGHINLSKLVKDIFTERAHWDTWKVRQAVRMLVRMLDNIIDITRYPLEEQAAEAKAKRRIGIGVTGLGNALQFLQLRYGSDEALMSTRMIMKLIANEAYRESAKLARERGAFPLFNKEAFLAAPFVRKLDADVLTLIEAHGIRNGMLLSEAPTGTNSIAQCDNCSGGIEPPFAHGYDRKVLQGDGSTFKTFRVYDYGYRMFKRKYGVVPDQLPSYMVTALELTASEHVNMVAAVQEWVDNSISKTVNCPASMTFEEFKNVYLLAYNLGCKCCATHRPDPASDRGSVLSTVDQQDVKPVTMMGAITKRPEELEGRTYKIRWPHLDEALYMTVNNIETPEGKRPFELFLSTKAVRHAEWMTIFTRLVSAIMRRGGDVTFLLDEMRQVQSAEGGGFIGKRMFPSLVAYIGAKLGEHFERIGLVNPNTHADVQLDICPRCNERAYVKQEGCGTCTSCHYSSCG